MLDRETRIAETLAGGPETRVALAVDLARPFIHKPRGPKEKPSKPTVEAPALLATFFATLGEDAAVGMQDQLVAPSQWRLEGGKLRFAEENQCVCGWACDPVAIGGPDNEPRVYYRQYHEEEWTDERISLSAFLLRFATVEAMFGSEESKSAASLPDSKLRVMLERMRILPFSDASLPAHPTQLFARGDVLALVCPDGEGVSSVWIGSDSREELAFIEDLLDGEWD